MSDIIKSLPPEIQQRLAAISKSKIKGVVLDAEAWFGDTMGIFAAGASYLIGGAPGSRKSGLVTQLALDVACSGGRVLYLANEEPTACVYGRLHRMWEGL